MDENVKPEEMEHEPTIEDLDVPSQADVVGGVVSNIQKTRHDALKGPAGNLKGYDRITPSRRRDRSRRPPPSRGR